jgi:hypothetical protein
MLGDDTPETMSLAPSSPTGAWAEHRLRGCDWAAAQHEHTLARTHCPAGPESTGSRPLRPAGIPFDDPRVADSETVTAKATGMARDLLIVGGGAIGIEYATIFSALGIPVRARGNQVILVPAWPRRAGTASTWPCS